jgi:hypothetical protein
LRFSRLTPFGWFRRGEKRADLFADLILDMTMMLPNKSPEPTGVGAGCSAIAVHVAGRRWLSFFR